MRVVPDRQGTVWTCTELYRTGTGAGLEGQAYLGKAHAVVLCGSERSVFELELFTGWESLSECELVEQFERALSGADEDGDEA